MWGMVRGAKRGVLQSPISEGTGGIMKLRSHAIAAAPNPWAQIP